MEKQPRTIIGFLFIGLLLLAAVAVGWWLADSSGPDMQTNRTEDEQNDRPGTSKRVVHLYFADDNSRYLRAEQRVIRQPKDDTTLVRLLIDALINGPRDGGSRTLPETSGLRSVFVLKDGRVVLDFAADAFTELPGGVGSELLAVYSIVNTLVLNVDSVRSIKILVDGRETQNLGGHVDIQQPFKANMLWVR